LKNSNKYQQFCSIFSIILFLITAQLSAQSNLTYPIVDTGQKKFYNNADEITEPSKDELFYGQDAQYNSDKPSYTDNRDGTITDSVTGLMWQKSPDLNGDGIINYDDKLTYAEAAAKADSFNLAGYTDWRLPTIKEIYSLINFNGIDPSGWNGTDVSLLTPFIDTNYFDFGYGDLNAGERIIDAQFATSTLYNGKTMVNNATMFGVNFADGRIKGYPYEQIAIQIRIKKFYVLYVRGNPNYGINEFVNNDDGTITDKATGLMWQQDDSQTGMNWEDALNWVQQKNSENYLGYNDWRLPNVKELQSIVDYSRSLQATNSAAIDTLFNCSAITDEGDGKNYPFYWSSTTHANMVNGSNAAYFAFGEALGWMQDPYGNYQLMDVHGAGAQRSDPKTGDPADYPYGHGPQGDVIRIYNYIRLVRDTDIKTSVGENNRSSIQNRFVLKQNYPNPFNPETLISYQIPTAGNVQLEIFDMLGKKIITLMNQNQKAGTYNVTFNAEQYSIPSGIYFYRIQTEIFSLTKKMILLK
jgi:hypothetical protein